MVIEIQLFIVIQFVFVLLQSTSTFSHTSRHNTLLISLDF